MIAGLFDRLALRRRSVVSAPVVSSPAVGQVVATAGTGDPLPPGTDGGPTVRPRVDDGIARAARRMLDSWDAS